MPEGHTIHMFASDQRKLFAKGRVSVSSPQGRFTDAKKIDGHLLRDVYAVGKNIFYEFDQSHIVHVHLGLHGKYTITPLKKDESPPEPRGAVRMRFINDSAVLDLNGPIRCEIIDQARLKTVIDSLGPDLLDPKADRERAWKKISKTSVVIGLVLMDQTTQSGLGNAYRCELLYRQKLHPLMPAKMLSRDAFDALWDDAVHLLKMGVRHRMAWAVDETDKLKNPRREDGEPDRYNVYRRETCRGCGAKIKVIPMGGRRVFTCPREQKLALPRSKPRSKKSRPAKKSTL